MKTSAVLLATVATMAAAQIPDLSALPSCATTCALPAMGQSGCAQLTDFKCLCNAKAFIDGLRGCVEKTCPPSDVATAQGFAVQLCASVGVTLDLPTSGQQSSAAPEPVQSSAAPEPVQSSAEPVQSSAAPEPVQSSGAAAPAQSSAAAPSYGAAPPAYSSAPAHSSAPASSEAAKTTPCSTPEAPKTTPCPSSAPAPKTTPCPSSAAASSKPAVSTPCDTTTLKTVSTSCPPTVAPPASSAPAPPPPAVVSSRPAGNATVPVTPPAQTGAAGKLSAFGGITALVAIVAALAL